MQLARHAKLARTGSGLAVRRWCAIYGLPRPGAPLARAASSGQPSPQRLKSALPLFPLDHFSRYPAARQHNTEHDPRRESGPMSKHEYELQVGRAIQILRATLPDFMRIGLSDYNQEDVDSSSSTIGVMGLNLTSLSGGLAKLFDAPVDSNRTGTHASGRFPSIYHASIAFRFRPPIPSSSGSRHAPANDHADAASSLTSGADKGGPAISFHGKTMYLASAHFLRHALSILFAETHIGIESMQLVKSQGAASRGASSNSASSPPMSEAHTSSRMDELVVRLRFEGQFRVTGTPHIYTAVFRYLFDPTSGQIIKHSVESIQPAPGRKVMAGLAAIWSRLVGEQQQPQPSPTAATSHTATCSPITLSRSGRR